MKTTKLLFFDWRHVDSGSLAWLTAKGELFVPGNPPEPQVPVRAVPKGAPRGIRLETQPAGKSGVVGNWRGWSRTMYHEGKYRSWYLEINGSARLGSGSKAQIAPHSEVFICGVESADGFQWNAPTRTRIHTVGQQGGDGVTFFIDPVAPPGERYKLVYQAHMIDEKQYGPILAKYMQRQSRHRDQRIKGRRINGLFAAMSPDGVKWTAVPEPLMLHGSDTDVTMFWDPDIERYVMYNRLVRNGRRWVGRAESENFATGWGPVVPILWPRPDDPPDYDIYLNGYSRYPGHPEYQLMFPMFWQRSTERSEVRLYSSPDGVSWTQAPGGPVIAPGTTGEWDSEFIGGGKDLMPFGPGRLAIPYSGTLYPHKYPRWPAVWDAWNEGWASWPEDRLCALKADYEGEFWTTELQPSGRRLHLNFRTPKAGLIRVGVEVVKVRSVEVLPGRSVEDCDPMSGDSMDQVVSWHGETDLKVPEGASVNLHFHMRHADLFSATLA